MSDYTEGVRFGKALEQERGAAHRPGGAMFTETREVLLMSSNVSGVSGRRTLTRHVSEWQYPPEVPPRAEGEHRAEVAPATRYDGFVWSCTCLAGAVGYLTESSAVADAHDHLGAHLRAQAGLLP
jgi:hypothetical protein